jgi:hypothetical protein
VRSLLAALLLSVLPAVVAAQETQPNAPASTPDTPSLMEEIGQLKAQMAKQQEQLAEQARQIRELRLSLPAKPAAAAKDASGDARLVNATLATPVSNPPGAAAASGAQPDAKPAEAPLSFHIGGAEFTPGGFLDFTSIFRTTNVGTLGTNFFNIPFNNQVAGHLTENRFTAQNSRISMKIHEKFGENDVTAFYEMDFLGNDAANVEVTSNGHTVRQRLY